MITLQVLTMDIKNLLCDLAVMNSLSHRLCIMLASLLAGSAASADAILVERAGLVQVQPSIWAAPNLEVPEPDTSLPIVGASNKMDGTQLLRIYSAQDTINGFKDIIYDNRDREHSLLDPGLFPRLTYLQYGEGLIDDDFDYGLAGRLVLPAVVIGNSSTALRKGPQRRSLPRLAMTTTFWQRATPLLYANNHIYVYPEHRDFDANDLFPLNWPYMIVSQGSSGSDRSFLNSVALTLAALPNDTFSFLREKGLIAPTVQMLLRRNLAPVKSRDDYLSGLAHPPVFFNRDVQTGRMVEDASKLRPNNIPPVVNLRAVSENFSEAAGLAQLDERLLDSPAAIGRVWHNLEWEREITITTADTVAPNDLPLTFEWHILRGDPERIKIERLDADGRTARIRVAWHDPWKESFSDKRGPVQRNVSRVDIGVFANNGVYDSAPSFLSISFPAHQERDYETQRDGTTRLAAVDYDARDRSAYFDPMIYWTAEWFDAARYDADGTLLGWDRTYTNDPQMVFVPAGDDAGASQHALTGNATLTRIAN